MVHISETEIPKHYKDIYGFYPKHLREWWDEEDVNDYHYELSVIDIYGTVKEWALVRGRKLIY